VKHSKSNEINVYFKEDQNNYLITIEDFGVGFDPNKITSKGYGLNNIRRRAKDLNGTVSIIADDGTTVLVSIPKKNS